MQRFILFLFMMSLSLTAMAATDPFNIQSAPLAITLITFFGLGVLLAFTPCVLPMVPILSGIIVGQKQLDTTKAFSISLVFVLSMALTYAIAGVVAGYFGSTLQSALQSPWIITLFSSIFVMMALSMFGLFELQMPSFLQQRLHKYSQQQRGGQFISVAVMGVLSTLIASPCVTAPLISVLTFISQSGNAALGGLILFVLALGMGLPLLLFGTGQGAWLPKTGTWMVDVKALFGVMMLAVAIWMLSRIIPDHITIILFALLLTISGIAFGALHFDWPSKVQRIKQGVSVVAFTYGVILLVGAALGNTSLLTPLQSATGLAATASAASQTLVKPAELFTPILTADHLQAKLKEAKKQAQPVVLEFYAGWCADCLAVDRDVLSKANVQQALQSWMSLRVDFTKDTPETKALKQQFQVYGPPVMIFFDALGNELVDTRMHDDITVEKLLAVLQR